MGKVLFVACTNVGEGMIEEIMTNPNICKTEIVGVVNLDPQVGLDKANYHTYLEVCRHYNIPLHYCHNINDPETIEWIESKQPELIIQTGWSQKFKDKVLSLPKYGCIGEHPAPLPKGRGAACINWAILTGEKEWGDTFFKMIDEYDKGAMYSQEFFTIEDYDNVKTVYDKVESASRAAVAKHIDDWSNGVFNPIEQSDEGATHYPRRRPADGLFSFDSFTAKSLHDFIRAQTYPYPGAFWILNDKKITAISSQYIDNVSSKNPGEIHSINDDGSVSFVCKDSKIIKIYRIKPEGCTEMWASEYFE